MPTIDYTVPKDERSESDLDEAISRELSLVSEDEKSSPEQRKESMNKIIRKM